MILLVVACLVHLVCGMYIGKMVERVAWNKLIQAGLLPVPRKRR